MCPAEPGKRGWVKTAHGSVRRVDEADKGYGIKTGKAFLCPKGAVLFHLKGLTVVQAEEADTWQGFVFDGAGGKQYKPACDRADVDKYPPLLINCPSRENGETNNLRITIWQDQAKFVVTKTIRGGEKLLVVYGGAMSRHLRKTRENNRAATFAQYTERRQPGHCITANSYCACGHVGLFKFRLRHWRNCPLRSYGNQHPRPPET